MLHGQRQGWLCPVFPGTSLTSSFALADQGALHKAVSLENEAHIIEETRLFQDLEPVQTLLLNSQKVECWVGSLTCPCHQPDGPRHQQAGPALTRPVQRA